MFMWTSDWRGWLRISCRRVLSWSPRNSSGPTREESGGRTSSWWSEDDARSPPPRPDTAISICITKWSRSCSEAPRAGQARPDACANVGPSKRPARCVRTTSGSGESRAGHHRPSSCRSAGRWDRSASRGSFGPQEALRTAGVLERIGALRLGGSRGREGVKVLSWGSTSPRGVTCPPPCGPRALKRLF